jgi:transposase
VVANRSRAGLDTRWVPKDVSDSCFHASSPSSKLSWRTKNWLFCWTELGAQQVGQIQSLLATCVLHDVDPYTYLVDVLQRIDQHPQSQVQQLTPRLWKQRFADAPLRSLLHRAPP